MARTYREIAGELVELRRKGNMLTIFPLSYSCGCGRTWIDNVRKDVYFSITQSMCKCGQRVMARRKTPLKAILDVDEQIQNLIERWGPE